jgi:CheY-like chemotaxis protein
MAKRLLVVDDGERLLRALSVVLDDAGYDVVTARNGDEALVRLSEQVPDLVITDIYMPGMNGFQLARSLRSAPRTAHIPIIFLSAQDEGENRIAGFRAGVDACIAKPFDPDDLLEVIDKALNS